MRRFSVFPKAFAIKIKYAYILVPRCCKCLNKLSLFLCAHVEPSDSGASWLAGKSVASPLWVILWFNGHWGLWPYLLRQRHRQAGKHHCISLGQGLLNFIAPGLKWENLGPAHWDPVVKSCFMWRHNRRSKWGLPERSGSEMKPQSFLS